jgi:valyl-tRNA synthetase
MTGYRQFINKIWNASRFVLMHVGELARSAMPVPQLQSLPLIHRWILHRLNAVSGEVKTAFETFRFDVAADRLYHFFWDEYADWYIEMVKLHLQAEGEERETARAVLLEVHDRVLRLLHPIIPFVTEELWQKLPRRSDDGQTICLAAYPEFREDWVDASVDPELAIIQGIVTTIRTARAERQVKPSVKLMATLEGARPEQQKTLTEQMRYVLSLAGLTAFDFASSAPTGEDVVTRVFQDLRVHIQMPHIDRSAELEKMRKQLADKSREIANIDAKLSNETFVSRAPAHIVDGARAQREKLVAEQRKIEETLKELEA